MQGRLLPTMCITRKVDPHRIQRLVTMQCNTSRTKRWKKPNLMCITMKKTFKRKQKKRIIKWVNNQVPTPSSAHDLKWCELESKLKRMLIKEWLCNLSEILSWKRSAPLSTNYSKKGTHVAALRGRSFHFNLKCAWKRKDPKLLTPIASKKNERKSNNNLKIVIRAIMAQ
jgi:hypothetical protein